MKMIVDGQEIELDKIMNEEELSLDTMEGFEFPNPKKEIENTKKIDRKDLEDTQKIPVDDLEDTKDYGELFYE